MELITGMKKQINVSLNYEELLLSSKLRTKGISYTEIYRTGLKELDKLVVDVKINNT